MLGPLISAGANIIGGLFNSASADKARDQAERHAQQQAANQREFAQQGLTWKIDDAIRNAEKVHPIYSLGSAGASYSPVSASFTADNSMGNAVASAGQDIGRAVSATATKDQRADAFTKASQALALEKGGLENELLRAELASKNGRLRATPNPPFPAPGANHFNIPGQVQSGDPYVKSKPLEVAPGAPGQPQSEGGAVTDVGYARTATGWAPVPSKDVKERMEDNIFQEANHFMRNNIFPTLGINLAPPPFAAPPGQAWVFNPLKQEYQLQTTKYRDFFRQDNPVHKPKSSRPWISDQFKR